jgi:hypothetical protein
MKFYLVKTTGELEVAIICILSGNNGKIIDFSIKESTKRNNDLVSIFKININSYFKKEPFLAKIYAILLLFTGNLVISTNSYGFSKFRYYLHEFFKVNFIRDALVPRFNNKGYKRLYCESQFYDYFERSNFIELSNISNYKFREKIINYSNISSPNQQFDCLVIGKSMNRTPNGLSIKKKFYEYLFNKYKRVGVIPHPRESKKEIELISEMEFSCVDMLIYMAGKSADQIFVINGSSALVFEMFEIQYNYMKFDDEFIYSCYEREKKFKNAKNIYNTVEELIENN